MPAPRLAVVAILALSLIAAACGSPTPTGTPPAGTGAPPASSAGASPGPAGPPPTVTIPQPPAMAAAATGSVEDQAAALAKAVAPGGQASLAPLLAAYQAAGIPVIGGDGKPLPGFEADQVGPGWWQVWLSAGGHPGFSVSLTDAMHLLLASPSAAAIDPGAAAAAALADLRAMAADSDPHRQFFARFITDLATAQSGVDPLAAGTQPDDVRLGPIAIELLVAGTLRSLVQAVVATDPGSALASSRLMASTGGALPRGLFADSDAPTGNSCNPTGDLDTASFWTQWLASKVLGGVNLPGMEAGLQSLVQSLVSSASLAKQIGTAAAVSGAVLSALTYLMEMASLTVSIELNPNPLVRTKHTSAGQETLLTATLSYDLKDSSLDGSTGIKNCLLVFANALGIQAALPGDGGVPGAEITFRGVDGFGQTGDSSGAFVQFPDQEQMKQDTSALGTAQIRVQGIAQKHEIPDSAAEWNREATVRIEAQPEAENARSLASMFWDSFTAEKAGPIGAIAPILDALKTVHYNLGEYSFLVTDWLVGWSVHATAPEGYALNGVKCDDTDGEWVLQGSLDNGTLHSELINTVTIGKGSLEGTFQSSSNNVVTLPQGTIVSTVNAKGHASLAIQKDGTVIVTLDATTATGTAAGAGTTQTITVPFPSQKFTWKSDPSACDKPPA